MVLQSSRKPKLMKYYIGKKVSGELIFVFDLDKLEDEIIEVFMFRTQAGAEYMTKHPTHNYDHKRII